MRKILVVLAMVGMVSGCTTTEQDVGVGTGAGAVVGMLLGRALAPRLAASRLQQIFSTLMAAVAIGMFVKAFGA